MAGAADATLCPIEMEITWAEQKGSLSLKLGTREKLSPFDLLYALDGNSQVLCMLCL